jgi:predicted ArsR family transcriptional regulator
MTASPFLRAADKAPQPGPVGHRGPRGAILLHLKRHVGATASELARELDCSLNAVRHHLRELEAEGAVCYDRTPNGVGAPAHTWRLTPTGHTLFPDRYDRTVLELLDHVVATQGREVAVALLERQYVGLGTRLAAAAGDLRGTERGEAVARALTAEGYLATFEANDAGGELVGRHCPHRLVAERFPEMCAAEQQVLSAVLEAHVTRRCRITAGCGTCTHVVRGET